jgi:hypothetical protein
VNSGKIVPVVTKQRGDSSEAEQATKPGAPFTLTSIGSNHMSGRRMTAGEKRLATTVYKTEINYGKVLIHNEKWAFF